MSIELKVFKNTEASLPLISYSQISSVSTTGLLVCPDLKEFIPNKADGKVQWYKVCFKTSMPLRYVLPPIEHIHKSYVKAIHPYRHTYTYIFRITTLVKMVVIGVSCWFFCGLGKVHVDRL